jgi:hypothetical protein
VGSDGIAVTVDQKANRIYHYLFNRTYRYCSRECAASFFRSFPTLASEYVSVRTHV